MLKKLLYVCCAGALLSTAACSSEDVAPVAEQESLVSFTVELPADAQARSRAEYGDGLTALNLQWQVYNEAGEKMDVQGTTTFTNRVATVTMRLANSRKYNILFWASATGSPYSFNPDTKEVAVNYTGVTAQDERHDAFFAHYEMSAAVSGSISETVYLYRPFAQVNIGATDATQAKNAGWETETTQVTISKAYKTLNLYTGEVSNPTEVVYAYAAKPAATETFPASVTAEYQSMVYVLTEPTSNLVDVKFEAKDNGDVITRTYTNVPVQRNYRTNIYGNILTEQANFTVEIVPTFNEPANVVEVSVASAADMNSALIGNNAETLVVNIAAGQLDWTAGAYHYFGGDDTKKVIIRGQGVSQTEMVLTSNYVEYFETKNPQATLVLEDMTVTRTQDPGAWETRCEVFRNCNVEINDVVFNRGVLFDCVGKEVVLNNVTVNELAEGQYAGWIMPGTNVTFKNCVVYAPNSGARNFKVDDSYSGANPQPTTINVNNSTFTFQKKTAILVKSTSATTINWGTGNTVNYPATYTEAQKAPVWVDSDRATYFDQVTVNGATKYQE